MRIINLAALSLLACGAAFAASRSAATTYADGNIEGVTPNSGGTLTYSDGAAMIFKTGSTSVPIPYAGISKTEVGATKIHSHDVPLYKVWELNKRRAETTKTQLLTVEFKTTEGEDKRVTLELAQPAAKSVLATIHARTAKNATPVENKVVASTKAVKAPAGTSANNDWWGDDYWKTSRNAYKWSKPAAATSAQQQQQQ